MPLLSSLDVLLKGDIFIGPTIYTPGDNVYFDDGDFTIKINDVEYVLTPKATS